MTWPLILAGRAPSVSISLSALGRAESLFRRRFAL